MKRVLAIAASLVVLVACNGDVEPRRPDPEPAPEATETEAEPEPTETEAEGGVKDFAGGTVPLQVWFVKPGRDGNPELLLHHVPVPRTEAIGRAALEQLLLGVPGPLVETDDALTVVPEDTELLGLTIDDGTARVDLNRAFEDTGMGATADGLQVAQVVYTLTQFPTVKRVEFLLEGEPVEMLGGHGIILDGPQTRKDWEQWLPPIVVETPHAGEVISDRFMLTGIANVFEATVSYRIRSESGRIIKKGFVTATCGTGCYGTFSQMVPIGTSSRSVVLEVFESSAEDGSPLHMVRIPLNFR